MSPTTKTESISASMCHRSISTLKLQAFEDILFGDDPELDGLIRKGDPSQEERQAAWMAILEEFSDKSATEEQKSLSDIARQITINRIRLQKVEICVTVLEAVYLKSYADQLRAMGFSYDFDPADLVQYKKNLKSVVSRSKMMILEIKRLEQLLTGYKPTQSDEKPDRCMFDIALVAISEVQGHMVTKEITVGMYCTLIQRLREKRAKTKNNGR